jgi:hypothetical protein
VTIDGMKQNPVMSVYKIWEQNAKFLVLYMSLSVLKVFRLQMEDSTVRGYNLANKKRLMEYINEKGGALCS